MTSLNRRNLIASAAAPLAAGPAFAQQAGHEHRGGHDERLNQPGRTASTSSTSPFQGGESRPPDRKGALAAAALRRGVQSAVHEAFTLG